MRVPILISVFLCFLVSSCSDRSSRLSIGGDPSWISAERALELCRSFLQRNGYTNAAVQDELMVREQCTFRFSTNGVMVPVKVLVNRKTEKVWYEPPKP